MALLTFADSTEFLERFEDIQVVLIGGQALNYWCSRYEQRIDLGDWLPTSADVDFQGGKEEARACAARIGGIPKIASLEDMAGHIAVLVVPRSAGDSIAIDFLDRPFGFTTASVVVDAARRVPLPGVSGRTVMLRIMHPIHCLKSRLHNVMGLPSRYDNPHGLNQLRASIQCARESILEQLQEQETRPAIDAWVSEHMAVTLRLHMKAAGLTRSALYAKGDLRGRFGLHSLRRSFITRSLALGKSADWVTRRSGHETDAMLKRYRQNAGGLAELALGEVDPLANVLPELAPKAPAPAEAGPGPGPQGGPEIAREGGGIGRRTSLRC